MRPRSPPPPTATSMASRGRQPRHGRTANAMPHGTPTSCTTRGSARASIARDSAEGPGGQGGRRAPRPRRRGNRGPPLTPCGRLLPRHHAPIPGIPTVRGGGKCRAKARRPVATSRLTIVPRRAWAEGDRKGVEGDATSQQCSLVAASTHVPAAAMATTTGPGREGGGRRQPVGRTPSLRHQPVPPQRGSCSLVAVTVRRPSNGRRG